MNTGSVWGGNCAGGICGNSGYGGKISSASNCYNVGSVEGGTDGLHALFVPEDSTDGVSSVTNCYYLDTLPTDTYGTPKTAAEFATGQVAWLLDHPAAGGIMNAASDTAGLGNGIWGQKLQRDAMGELVTTLSSGDAYPAFRGTEHPAVARMDYTFHDELGSPSPVVDAKDLFLNEGSMMALVTSGTSTPWAHYSDNGYTNKLDNPYNTGTAGVQQNPAGYYPVFVKLGIVSWADVGKLQDETDLRNTYWDASSSTWINDGSTPAAGTAALEGDTTRGFTIRSEKAFAWWAYQVSMNATDFRTANATLEAAAGHAGTFDLAGEEYGYGADATVVEDGTVDAAKAKYAGCLPWKPVQNYNATFSAYGTSVENLYVYESNAALFNTVGPVSDISPTFTGVAVESGYVDGKSNTCAAAIIASATSGAGDTVSLTDCRNAATIFDEGTAGGLVGSVGRGKLLLERCANEGSVSADGMGGAYSCIGGLVGIVSDGTVALKSCVNAGAVSNQGSAAGLVGVYCDSTYVPQIENCLSIGEVSDSTTSGVAAPFARTVADADLVNSYCLETICPSASVSGLAYPTASKTAAQLKTWGAAYQLNGGATGGGSITDPGNVAGMDAWTWTGAGAYPSLIPHDAAGAVDGQHMANASDWGAVGAWVENFDPKDENGQFIRPAYLMGMGSAAGNPISIETPEGLAWYAQRVNSANGTVIPDGSVAYGSSFARLAQVGLTPLESISLLGAKYTDAAQALAWVPIGTSGAPYSGGFDGNGMAIADLRVNGSTANQGLFGYAAKGSVADAGYIKDLSLSGSVASSNSSTDANVGGLIGYGEGITVSDVLANVDVDAQGQMVGGIVGNAKNMVVERSSHTGAVKSIVSSIGGIVGNANGLKLRDSFHEGMVEGASYVGGLGGYLYSTDIVNSYASSAVNGSNYRAAIAAYGNAKLYNCYYNKDLCNTSKTGSTGKTTAEFASGEVAWLLDTADVNGTPLDEIAATDDETGRGVWGQKVVRDATGNLAYDSGNPSTYAGDALPRFWDGSAGSGFTDGTEHPRVAKVGFSLHEPDFPGETAPVAAYANIGDAVALPAPGAGETWWYWLHGVDSGIALAGSPWSVGGEPLNDSEFGVAYYPVTIAKSVGSWAVIGAQQNEADLRQANAQGVVPLSGKGSEDEPFVLSTPEALAWFAHMVNFYSEEVISNSDSTNGGQVSFDGSSTPRTYQSACAQLGRNINLFGTQATGSAQDYIDSSTSLEPGLAMRWQPIGFSEMPYLLGTFDGQGNTIDYLNVVLGSDVVPAGLFATVMYATVQGVNVGGASQVVHTGAAAASEGAMAGGIAGMAMGSTIDGCSFAGAVESVTAGGVVGFVTGDKSGYRETAITNCSNTGQVEGVSAGGLAGGWMVEASAVGVRMEHSYNRGSANGSVVGGLLGVASLRNKASVSTCYSTGSVVCEPTSALPGSQGSSAAGLVGAVVDSVNGEFVLKDSYVAAESFVTNANVAADAKGALVGMARTRPESTTQLLTLEGCRYENSAGTPLAGLDAVGSSCLGAIAGGSVTPAMAEGVFTADLQNWAAAYAMNGDTYVGSDGNGLPASTVWTVDNTSPEANRGYLVFGDLKATPVSATLDPDDMAGTSDGTVLAPLLNGLTPVTFAGPVQVVEGAAFSSDDTGATVPDLADSALGVGSIKDAYTTRGTTNAAAKIALQLVNYDAVAGTAGNPVPLAGNLAAGGALGAAGDSFSGVSLNAAAAYNRADALSYATLLASGRNGYAVEISVDKRDSLTAQVDVPVDAETFTLEPDGTVQTSEAVDQSVVQNKGTAPVAGSISAVEALAEGSHQVGYDANNDGVIDGNDVFEVTDVLLPTADGTSPLADSNDPIDGDLVRLGLKDCAELDPLKLPLYYVPGVPGANGTIPLAFALPGTVGSPTQLAYRYFMDYTGTYVLQPGTTQGAFGYKVSYDIALSANDVDAEQASVSAP